MNSKQRIQSTIEFSGPDRLPYLPIVDIRRFQNKRSQDIPKIIEVIRSTSPDVLPLEPQAPPGSKPTSAYRAMVEDGEDMWGVAWKEGFAITHPLADNGFDLRQYEFPDPGADGLFEIADGRAAGNKDKYLLGMVWWTMFERMHLLRGFDNALVDYILYPEQFKRLQARIFEYDMTIMDHWIDLEVDGIYFSDDWGDNHRLLINPRIWRELWKPYYRKLFKRVRENGMHVWFHSCGNVLDIIPDLLELGLNVLNPVQPRAMNINVLAERYGGKLCFYGGVDVQETLPKGNPEDVRRAVRYLIDTFGAFNGGYIGGVSHSIIDDVPLENILALYQAFEDFS